METQIIRMDEQHIDREQLVKAGEIIKAGGLVVWTRRRCFESGVV